MGKISPNCQKSAILYQKLSFGPLKTLFSLHEPIISLVSLQPQYKKAHFDIWLMHGHNFYYCRSRMVCYLIFLVEIEFLLCLFFFYFFMYFIIEFEHLESNQLNQWYRTSTTTMTNNYDQRMFHGCLKINKNLTFHSELIDTQKYFN